MKMVKIFRIDTMGEKIKKHRERQIPFYDAIGATSFISNPNPPDIKFWHPGCAEDIPVEALNENCDGGRRVSMPHIPKKNDLKNVKNMYKSML